MCEWSRPKREQVKRVIAHLKVRDVSNTLYNEVLSTSKLKPDWLAYDETDQPLKSLCERK